MNLDDFGRNTMNYFEKIMEILNNIWMALSTPNEGLIDALSIPFLLIEKKN